VTPSTRCLGAALLLLTGCASQPPPATTTAGPSVPASPPPTPSISARAEVGALDEDAVRTAFNRTGPKVLACVAAGAEREPAIAGDVELYVRVGSDGSARYAYPSSSNLGDVETERCIAMALTQASWPKPMGGEQGIAKRQMHFDPGDGAPLPAQWPAEKLGGAGKKLEVELAACRKAAATGPLDVTFYLDAEGKARSIGVAMSDERGSAAIDCVVLTLRRTRLPRATTSAAKVTLRVP